MLTAAADRERSTGDLDATALRMGSVALRDVFALRATAGTWTYDELRAWALESAGKVRPRGPSSLDGGWTSRLARVVALQDLRPEDGPTALALYHVVHDRHDVSTFGPTHAKLYCDLMLWGRQDVMLSELLPDLGLAPDRERLVRADLENPHRGGPLATAEELWRSRFRRAARFPPTTQLEPTSGCGRPFDRLAARGPRSAAPRRTPLVTVVMNVFRPDSALRGAVRSLLAQTHEELEILVVDDGSGPAHAALFAEVAGLDARIRLITLDKNLGAYGARNVALDHANGTYVTFQDYDDWSLPQRIEAQVDVLEADAALVATRARTTKLYEDLTFAHPGYRPHQIHAASLFFRRCDVMLGIGYFDEARKGADNEYHERIAAHFGSAAIHDLPSSTPSLMAYRRTAGSLSRDEFRPGWRHPARWAYRNAYMHWHRSAPRDGLFLERDGERRFPAPRRFLGPTADDVELDVDVVVVADWRSTSTHVERALAAARTVTGANGRLGLFALEAVERPEARDVAVAADFQTLVNEGAGHLLHEDDRVHVALVVVADPSVVEFADPTPVGWAVVDAWVVGDADEAAPSRPPTPRREHGDAMVQSMFGVSPQWVSPERLVPRLSERLAHRRPETFRHGS